MLDSSTRHEFASGENPGQGHHEMLKIFLTEPRRKLRLELHPMDVRPRPQSLG